MDYSLPVDMTTLPQPYSRGHNDPKERAEETEDCHHSVRSSPSKPLHQTRGDGGEEKCSDSRATDTDTCGQVESPGEVLTHCHHGRHVHQTQPDTQTTHLNASQYISIHLKASQCTASYLMCSQPDALQSCHQDSGDRLQSENNNHLSEIYRIFMNGIYLLLIDKMFEGFQRFLDDVIVEGPP